MSKRILIVEDDAALARVLRDNLVLEGYQVESVADGDVAITTARTFTPDLVLLDLMLPGKNGFELCRRWRQKGQCSVIVLTARSLKSDKLQAFELGADDYVTKPFDLDELMARINSVLRRGRPAIENLVLGSITIDFAHQTARNVNRQISLTSREFELLRYLAERRDTIVYRDQLLREVWGYLDSPITRAVDHAIARLRRKLEIDARCPTFIHTVHGDGYFLAPDGVSGQKVNVPSRS